MIREASNVRYILLSGEWAAYGQNLVLSLQIQPLDLKEQERLLHVPLLRLT